MRQPAPYPWNAIERVPRDALTALRGAREALAGMWGRTSLESALTEVIGEPARLVSSQLRAARHRSPRPRSASCLFLSRSGSSRVWLEVEPELAARLTARLLRRPLPMVDPLSPVPDSIQGAVAAIALTVGRRIALDDRLALHATGAAALDALRMMRSSAVAIDATILLTDEAFEVSLIVDAAPCPTGGDATFDRTRLEALGGLMLSLQVVVASAETDGALLESLAAGDVLLAGQGWWVARSEQGLAGRAILCAEGGSLGLPVNLFGDGRIVVLEGTMTVDVDKDAPAPGSDPSGSSADVLAEAPVVVRVELGQVSMTAREWAALRAGDIITTGSRIAERAVLRVAGREVARGELVDVDGELGVRIHELIGQHDGGRS
ncbi:MAG: FliM/FliN family flagellar motor switch protein [Deltaproteobacteria bacterium]|nr:FliM/FliN family flagellar motor switch protein [Deltaproteobacteria bacterium]